MPRKELLENVKRIVVKVGTSIITEADAISERRISSLVSDIVFLLSRKYQVVLVSSGAIGAGLRILQKDLHTMSIPEKQALASVGQIALMNEYRNCFTAAGYEVGQILLTEDDVKNKRRYLNARHTFNALFKFGVVPIVNENDSVVVKEIKFGENDTLSAYVTNIVEADLLILLSDVDGFFWEMSDEEPIEEIDLITDEVRKRAGGAGSRDGTGGMNSKINAADIVIRSGEMMIVANGQHEGILRNIMNGERIGTIFRGKECSLNSRKRWIAFNTEHRGELIIDGGAAKAIREKKKSLLASGILSANGIFEMGDAVEICDEQKKPLGKGIINYSNEELEKIKGLRTDEIEKILGDNFFDEVINRDDMIIY